LAFKRILLQKQKLNLRNLDLDLLLKLDKSLTLTGHRDLKELAVEEKNNTYENFDYYETIQYIFQAWPVYFLREFFN